MGKSSLALQLIDRGAVLVSDDQTLLRYENEKVILQPPGLLQGMMEVRGVGLCAFPFQPQAYLGLCVEIAEKDELERLPDPHFKEYYGIPVPLLKLEKDDPLGPIKIELKLANRVRVDV
jgi:serine kinase of HPr protein (carbohydrate metabolism regulator)